MKTWSKLPEGEALELEPGVTYAVVASVKATHSPLSIKAMINRKAMALLDYAEEGERAGLGPDPRAPDYRYVAAMARALEGGSIPWSIPWPLSLVDDSAIVEAWSSRDTLSSDRPPPTPPLPTPRPTSPATPPIWPIALGLAAAAAWGAWRTGRKIRR